MGYLPCWPLWHTSVDVIDTLIDKIDMMDVYIDG